MTDEELLKAADRVIAYLERCGRADIEAGVGAVLGIEHPDYVAKFRQEIADAIRGAECSSTAGTEI